MCPLYIAGPIGPGDRKSIQPVAQRLGISKRFVVEFNGQAVKEVNKGFGAARAKASLGKDVTPHVLWHTCATWLVQAGPPFGTLLAISP